MDWAQLSLLGDVEASTIQREMVQRFSHVLGTNLEGDPSVRHGHPGALTCSCIQPKWLQGYFTPNPANLRLREGLAPVVWRLSLAPGTEASSSPHPLTPSP